MIWILIAIGGSIGALSRWIVTLVIPHHGSDFPVAITIVNLVGSFALGFAVGLDRVGATAMDLLPLTTGALGGFTTFSTWMVDIDTAGNGTMRSAIAFLPALAGVLAAAIGIAIGASAS